MGENRTFASGKDWSESDGVIRGKADAKAAFRGLQADLNDFAETVGFAAIKVDGALGPKTVAAARSVYDAAVKKNPALGGSIVPPSAPGDLATHALTVRQWLETTARSALGLTELRRYHQGAGKEWNTRETIAYGAGPVHEDFQKLQDAVNRFAATLGFTPLERDGFLGEKTVKAVNAIYEAAVKKNPTLAATVFPPPDSKEEVAEYAQFIRRWLETAASKALLAEAGA
jgi:lysozyme family protein